MVQLKKNFHPRPGACYGVLFISNFALAYSGIPAVGKGWVFVLGIIFPLILLLRAGKPTGGKKFLLQEYLPVPNRWFWLGLAGAALFLRFYRITDLYGWPTGDEGLHGFLALHLTQHWDWRFFYTVGEHPPLLIWSLALLSKFVPSTFFDLWFLPAVFSALTVPMGYLVARRFFSRSLSVLLALLLAASFWPLYAGRFCHQGLFIPFWELSSFWILSSWMGSRRPRSARLWALGLGLWSGLGAWTFTAWFTVLALLVATVLVLASRKKLKGTAWFLAGLLLAMAPFLVSAYAEGYGHHLIDASSWSRWFGPGHRFWTHLSYFTALFWGPLLPSVSYGPVWGGVLNPVLSSFFFLGIARICRRREEPMAAWIGMALVVCLAPAFLAGDYVEFNRIIQVMPFLLLVVGIGFQDLFLSWGGKIETKKLMAFGGLLLLSFGLDLNHFFKPSTAGPFGRPHLKSSMENENFNAFQVLRKTYQERGTGLIFVDFLPLQAGHTLYVATYPFNGAANPRLGVESETWAGVVTNVYYEPFLAKRFPGSRWYWTGEGAPPDQGGLAVGIIPRTPGNRRMFDRWLETHACFDRMNLQAEESFNNPETYRQSLAALPGAYPLVKGDPFLEAVYWEWCSQYFYSPSYSENIQALGNAVRDGYPAVHLYRKAADLLRMEGKTAEADRMMEKVGRLKNALKLPEGPVFQKSDAERRPSAD